MLLCEEYFVYIFSGREEASLVDSGRLWAVVVCVCVCDVGNKAYW